MVEVMPLDFVPSGFENDDDLAQIDGLIALAAPEWMKITQSSRIRFQGSIFRMLWGESRRFWGEPM
jgi:hypothetical protein